MKKSFIHILALVILVSCGSGSGDSSSSEGGDTSTCGTLAIEEVGDGITWVGDVTENTCPFDVDLTFTQQPPCTLWWYYVACGDENDDSSCDDGPIIEGNVIRTVVGYLTDDPITAGFFEFTYDGESWLCSGGPTSATTGIIACNADDQGCIIRGSGLY